MNERFFGDRAQAAGIRPGRLLIRKTRKNPKKKTRNHEREIFRGSGPRPQGSVQERLLIRKNPEKNPKKKRPETMNERFFSGIRAQAAGSAQAAGIREILVSERIQKDEQQVQEGF
ncbi:unnamed protein product [Caenorhabditis auriculariae]|uniref:Uncharacterized protein n=1 Tax=Caenorhabditis auriculariae TaxID=2777116 RepID=A0A8S1HDL1_9PELO|nr:unnamed protein product [Caenorhabditis auriculariae]